MFFPFLLRFVFYWNGSHASVVLEMLTVIRLRDTRLNFDPDVIYIDRADGLGLILFLKWNTLFRTVAEDQSQGIQ
jgi:hypothetical protein